MGTSKDILIDEIYDLKDKVKKYKKGFNLLMKYFDSIADEEKPEVDKQLKALGL